MSFISILTLIISSNIPFLVFIVLVFLKLWGTPNIPYFLLFVCKLINQFFAQISSSNLPPTVGGNLIETHRQKVWTVDMEHTILKGLSPSNSSSWGL